MRALDRKGSAVMKETKKSRLERCRALIDRQKLNRLGADGVPLPGFQPFSEVDLMEFYEITLAPALVAIRTVNPKWPSDIRHVRVQFIDGVWEGLSWKDCINGSSWISEMKKILRCEIEDDLADARSALEPKICARPTLNPKCTPTINLTADHKEESFDSIARAFITLHSSIDVAAGPSGGSDIIKDRDLAAEWIQFHASRATYQLLCVSCNSKKGRGRKSQEK